MPTRDFKNFLETLDKIKTAQNCSSIIIFSDINLQTTWEVLSSEDEYESALLEKLEDMSFYQALPNRNGRNLDICLTQLPETVEHSCIDSEIETSFSTSEKKCSDHYSFRTVFSFEFKRTRSSPKKMLAFKKANWEQMNMYISEHPFIPYCFSNIVELVKQWYIWLQKVIVEKVPRVTAHRSSLPPWISPSTSHIIKKIATMRKKHEKTGKLVVLIKIKKNERNLRNEMLNDQTVYEEKFVSSRRMSFLQKYLKSLHKIKQFSDDMYFKQGEVKSTIARDNSQKCELFNQFISSVFTPSEKINLKDCKKSALNTVLVTEEVISKILKPVDPTTSVTSF